MTNPFYARFQGIWLAERLSSVLTLDCISNVTRNLGFLRSNPKDNHTCCQEFDSGAATILFNDFSMLWLGIELDFPYDN